VTLDRLSAWGRTLTKEQRTVKGTLKKGRGMRCLLLFMDRLKGEEVPHQTNSSKKRGRRVQP